MRKKDSGELKLEHRVVLCALEVANVTHQRAATVQEVARALSLRSKDYRLIKKSYSSEFNAAVGKILTQLHHREVIFSPGVAAGARYYGSEKALPPEARALPSLITRRRHVLQLVRNTVLALGRAVRTGDVIAYVSRHSDEFDVNPELITRDMLNLKTTGDLLLVECTLRRDDKGKNYYLPRDLDPTGFAVERPLTWLEEVASSFKKLWAERSREATVSNRLPRPISSVELRDRMVTLPQPHPNLRKRMFLVNALTQLSETSSAVVRKVRRPSQRTVLWAPSDVPDDKIDLGDLFVSDAERIGEAVGRAVKRLGRPVNVKDIRAEIKFDSMLYPATTASLPLIVSDVSKVRLQSSYQGVAVRNSRKLVRVYRAGRIDNDTYYYHSQDGLDDAKFYVQFEHLKRKWSAYGTTEQLRSLTSCAYPTIALGRALLLETDAKHVKASLERLLRARHGTVEVRGNAESLLDQVRSVTGQLQAWLKDRSCPDFNCPSEVNPEVPAWTAAELLAFLKPLYPLAQEIMNPNQLIRLVFRSIRRVPNPHFRSRFKQSPDEAAEYFFDRTDALLYAAQKWGGFECCFQSALAASHLGLLRDARFIFPLLSRNQFDDRLTGVACLAFLQTMGAVERLRTVAVKDESPAVRGAALWACGFIGGQGVNDLLASRQKDDSDLHIREFCAKAQHIKPLDWWTLQV